MDLSHSLYICCSNIKLLKSRHSRDEARWNCFEDGCSERRFANAKRILLGKMISIKRLDHTSTISQPLQPRYRPLSFFLPALSMCSRSKDDIGVCSFAPCIGAFPWSNRDLSTTEAIRFERQNEESRCRLLSS